MKRCPLLLIVICLFPALIALAAENPAAAITHPIPAIQRMLIISIDGLRPDVLLRAPTPYIRSLMDKGAFTMWARTTAVAITLPSHVSMLTGVTPVRHGIQWNEDLPLAKPYYTKVPTIFELAHSAGYKTALVSGKAKFAQIPRPGVVDWLFVPMPSAAEKAKEAAKPMEKQATKKNVAEDELVMENAIRILSEHRPELMFVHFATVDVIGHGKGWGSTEQLQAVAGTDRCIGEVLKTLETLGLLNETAIILSSDHGGAGHGHGPDDVRARHIPWILTGPGVKKNYDLTLIPELEVNTYDTFSTACYLLGISVPRKVDGKPILEAFDKPAPIQ